MKNVLACPPSLTLSIQGLQGGGGSFASESLNTSSINRLHIHENEFWNSLTLSIVRGYEYYIFCAKIETSIDAVEWHFHWSAKSEDQRRVLCDLNEQEE